MKFKSRHIEGKGRGKTLGFPTINLEVPKRFSLEIGIWAVAVQIKDNKYIGALHFGSVPTFKEHKLSLEVFLINTNNKDIPDLDFEDITIEPVKRLRDVELFSSPEKLIDQIKRDVENVKKVFNLQESI